MRKLITAWLIATSLCANASAAGMEMSGSSTLFREPYEQGPFIELLLKHSSGKRAGYDRKSRRILLELSQSCYAEPFFGENPKSKSLAVGSPLEGSYSLYITANDSGIYSLRADITTPAGFVAKSITGLLRKGDTQEVEICYASSRPHCPVKKKVDTVLLKKELEIALIKGRLDKETGRAAARELVEAERALANKADSDALTNIRSFIRTLEKRRAKLNTGSARTWFADTHPLYDQRGTEKPGVRELMFDNIAKIKDGMKESWFEAQSLGALIDDAKTLRDDISNRGK
jgi:hypothetical protein